MAVGYYVPTQPADCASTVPAVSSQLCVNTVTTNKSEIRMILFSPKDAATGLPEFFPTDPNLAADWATAETAGIKRLYVEGDEPLVTPVTQIINGQTKPIETTRLINFDVKDANDTNYEFARTMQYGWTGFIWYVTAGNVLYGASTQAVNTEADYWPYGIEVNIYQAHMDKQRGADSIETIKFIAEYKHIIDPPRISTSPLTVPG